MCVCERVSECVRRVSGVCVRSECVVCVRE